LCGYPIQLLTEALTTLHPGQTPTVLTMRCSRLRRMNAGWCIDALLCSYRVAEGEQWVSLWGRRYATDELFDSSVANARDEGSGRRLLAAWSADRMSIEYDAGEALLPKLEF